MIDLRELVFVYGTLRHGGTHFFRMERAQPVGKATVAGRLYRIDWYPGLVLDSAAGLVQGELFGVDAAHLQELDAFEGIAPGETEGEEYRRVRAAVWPAAGDAVQAWVWEWIGPIGDSRLIHSGDWLNQGR